MIRNLAAIICLAVFSWLFALSTQSVEAKTSVAKAKNPQNTSRTARNYFVPPPPPYTPSVVPSVFGMMSAQVVTADTVEKPVIPYSNYIFTRNQGEMPQVVQPNPYVSYHRAAETSILKHIENFDSEISNHEKEIGKLLNL